MIHWTSLPVLSNAVPIGRLIVLRDVTEDAFTQPYARRPDQHHGTRSP